MSGLTKKEKEYEYCNETIEIEKQIKKSFLVLGERLLKIRDGDLFLPSWTSFREFLMEMGMSEGTASKLINIYSRFTVEFAIPEKKILAVKGWSIVAEILPFAKTKKEAEYWLDVAAINSREDTVKLMKEKKTGIDMSACSHANFYVMRVCRDCKDKWVENN